MKTELLNEGWVKFSRVYFTEGFIDRWHGDSINNPNNPNKHHLQLNAITSYFRLNGSGEWIHNSDLFKMDTHISMTDLTAQMIWDNCYHDYQKLKNKPH